MSNLLGRSKLFVKRNGSTILTYVGAAGVVATTVTAVKATPKALMAMEVAEVEKGEKLTKMEVLNVAGPMYIPSVLIGTGTIACIFGANILNKRQQAALMSAYAMLDSSYKEYKAKVNELYGEDADGRVQTEIAKDKYEENGIVPSEGKQLFYDMFSKRYFESTLQAVKDAEVAINKQIVVNTGAYLNEFYEFLGLDPMESGYEYGWSQGILESMYWSNWVEFDHSTVTLADEVECIAITMMQEPVIDFAYY